jgi:hypothetical protein
MTAFTERYYRPFFLVFLFSYVVVQVALVPTLHLSYEEGISLQISRLISRGYTPYSEIFTLANPLFVWLVGRLGQFGISPTDFKLIFFSFGLILLANTYIIAYTLMGRKVALAAIFLLATTPTFLAETATGVIAVTPALSVATLSLVFALRFLITQRWAWLFASGLTWGVALFVSTSVFSIGLVALVLILFFNVDESRAGSAVLNLGMTNMFAAVVWLLGVSISLGLGVMLANPEIILSRIIENHLALKENLPAEQKLNFQLVGQFVAFNCWLSLFAVYGLVQIYDQPKHPLWIALIWGLLSFVWLMLHEMLRLADMAILLPALAMIAGWGLVSIGHRVLHWSSRWKFSEAKQQLAWIGASLLLLSCYLFIGWQQVTNFNFRDIDTEGEFVQLEQRQEIVNFIRKHTDVHDCVIIDDPALAIAADRLPAPQLVELSRERIVGGLITISRLETLTQDHGCKAVVFSRRKYTQPLSEFKDWARAYFPNHEQGFTRTTIYYR